MLSDETAERRRQQQEQLLHGKLVIRSLKSKMLIAVREDVTVNEFRPITDAVHRRNSIHATHISRQHERIARYVRGLQMMPLTILHGTLPSYDIEKKTVHSLAV
jgi:hypothetical protein